MSHINLVNGQAHNESLVAQLVRAPNRYLGGHGFDSRQGLRIFLCPMLVSLLKKIIFKVFLAQKGTRNKTVLNYQFGNNVFHEQIGTQNKTVLSYPFGNNVFHLQKGTRNKTVLSYQFGNNVFHSHIGTRNNTVLSYQFGNIVFHAQTGTRNKTVLN